MESSIVRPYAYLSILVVISLFPLQEREEEEKEQKEQEFVAERKMEELSKMEGGDQELVYNQVSSSMTPPNVL